jgi:hypothetical protein
MNHEEINTSLKENGYNYWIIKNKVEYLLRRCEKHYEAPITILISGDLKLIVNELKMRKVII